VIFGRKLVVARRCESRIIAAAAVVFLLLLRVPVWGVVVFLLSVVGCCLGMWWGQWARDAEGWRGLANRCRRCRGWPSLPSLRASASTSASATLGRLMAISCPLSARCPSVMTAMSWPVPSKMRGSPAGEGGADELAEADAEYKKLHEDIAAMEVRTLLGGEYDEREALVNIRSGAGGVDAADWAEMLMRMYIRWAEKHSYPVEVFDTSYAEEAGIKSATFAVHAPFAYGTLSVEQGTHRLVRISPFDNQGRRQTSFAEVEVLPVTETTDHIDIPETDVRVDVYRSSGPGGQSVNTTDSAVRLTHIPTGIVVTCQNEKSQLQNKVSAMRVLQAKLLERKRLEERAELDALKSDSGSSWGNQMRSYVLHPYQMVKDLRTDYEVGNPAALLDGDIDGFLEAGIRWRNRRDDE
jgi:peptide chain release factor 2